MFIVSAMSEFGHPSSSSTICNVKPGHVYFVLYSPTQDGLPFYLDLSIDDINMLCLKPIKYLKYLAWCILGVLGDVVLDCTAVGNEEKLCNQSVYYFESAENVSE